MAAHCVVALATRHMQIMNSSDRLDSGGAKAAHLRHPVPLSPKAPRTLRCTLLAITLLGSQAFGDYLEIEGYIDCTFYLPDQSLQTNQFIRFSIELETTGATWLIRTYFGSGPDWYYETFGVGEAVYNVHYNANTNPSWSMPASVYPGYYPYLHFYHVTATWLAFCSSPFFTNHDHRAVPFLFWNAASYPQAYAFESTVGFLDNEHLRIPRSIIWTTTEERMASAHLASTLRLPTSSSEARRQNIDLRYRFPVGSVVGRYDVLAVTNVEGMSLPERFEFKKYSHIRDRTVSKGRPSRAPNPEDLKFTEYLHAHFIGRLAGVRRVPGSLGAPPFPKDVQVADYRLSDKAENVAFTLYTITDGAWKTNIDHALMALLEEQRAAARRSSQAGGLGIAHMAFLVVFLALPLAILIWRKRARLHV